MHEHIKNNKFLLISAIFLLVFDKFYKFPSLGTIWTKLHANSLIGLQKLVESNFSHNNLFINIWENYIILCLSYKISNIFLFIFICIIIFKIIKKLIHF